MRTLQRLVVAALLSGCSGISIGESGEDPSESELCAPDGEVEIEDLNATVEDLDGTPAEQVANAETRLTGTLDLASGPDVPVTLELRVDGAVRLITSSSPQDDCPAYLRAEATLDIDAGDSLRGVVRGELYIREPLQFRGEWATPLDELETNLEPPDFGAAVVKGPVVNAYLLLEQGEPWIGSLDYAAHVATEPCDERTEMCTNTPGNFTPKYRPLGELTDLEPVP